MSSATVLRFVETPILLLVAALALPCTSTSAQDYRSSVVGTDFDYITEADPSAFLCLEFKDQGLREMPDKRGPSPLIQEAFIFVSYFTDGTSVDMAIDADFGTEVAARTEALRYVPRLGKLPTSLRRGVDRLVVHEGGADTTAFSDVGLIVVYSGNATKRISTHDLEETIFHESVHAAWDKKHADSAGWRAAQAADGAFVTHYARKNPDGEDLAESALFAYTLLHHPDRIPAADAAGIKRAIPARIAFVEALLPPNQPIFQEVGPTYACDGSGTTFTVSAERGRASQAAFEAQARAQATSGSKGTCTVDLSKVGVLSDIVSNALMRGLDLDESKVSSFLGEAKVRCRNSEDLLRATANEFGIDRATLDAQVQAYLHCNCNHGDDVEAEIGTGGSPAPPAAAGTTSTLPAVPSGFGSPDLRPTLYLIASLLLLLLVVSTSTLVVLVKHLKTAR